MMSASRTNARVLVREKACGHAADVVVSGRCHLAAQRLLHDRRDVARNHAGAARGDRERELAGSGAEVQHRRIRVQAQALQQAHLAVRVAVLLGVIARHVTGVEVLPSRAGSFVEPTGSRRVSHLPRLAEFHAGGSGAP